MKQYRDNPCMLRSVYWYPSAWCNDHPKSQRGPKSTQYTRVVSKREQTWYLSFAKLSE